MDLPRFVSASAALNSLEFDAAVCLMSNREGAEATLQLAQAGKHLVMEKPGAGSSADAQQILEAARRTGALS